MANADATVEAGEAISLTIGEGHFTDARGKHLKITADDGSVLVIKHFDDASQITENMFIFAVERETLNKGPGRSILPGPFFCRLSRVVNSISVPGPISCQFSASSPTRH